MTGPTARRSRRPSPTPRGGPLLAGAMTGPLPFAVRVGPMASIAAGAAQGPRETIPATRTLEQIARVAPANTAGKMPPPVQRDLEIDGEMEGVHRARDQRRRRRADVLARQLHVVTDGRLAGGDGRGRIVGRDPFATGGAIPVGVGETRALLGRRLDRDRAGHRVAHHADAIRPRLLMITATGQLGRTQ